MSGGRHRDERLRRAIALWAVLGVSFGCPLLWNAHATRRSAVTPYAQLDVVVGQVFSDIGHEIGNSLRGQRGRALR
jgi:hypothetical protein